MRLFYDIGKNFIKTPIYLGLIFLDAILISGYEYCSKNLIKPSGLREVFSFWWKSPNEYGLSLLTGTLAFILTYFLLILNIINIVKFITGESTDSVIIFIIKTILPVILFVISIIFLKGLGSLALAAIIVVGLVYLWIGSS